MSTKLASSFYTCYINVSQLDTTQSLGALLRLNLAIASSTSGQIEFLAVF